MDIGHEGVSSAGAFGHGPCLSNRINAGCQHPHTALLERCEIFLQFDQLRATVGSPHPSIQYE